MSVRHDSARTDAGRAFEVRLNVWTMLVAGEPDPGVHVPAARCPPGGLDDCRHDGRRTVRRRRRRRRGRPAAAIPVLRGRHAQGRPGRAWGPRGRRRLVPVDGGRRPRRRPRRPRPRADRRRPVPGRIVRPTGRSRAREVHVPALGLSILAVRVFPASRYPFTRHSFSSKVFAIEPRTFRRWRRLVRISRRHTINRRRTQRVISSKNHTSAGPCSNLRVRTTRTRTRRLSSTTSIDATTLHSGTNKILRFCLTTTLSVSFHHRRAEKIESTGSPIRPNYLIPCFIYACGLRGSVHNNGFDLG